MNIVLQHWTGDLGELESLSMRNISNYAKLVGAEYAFLQGNVFRKNLSPPCQKLFMLSEEFDSYDTVLMLDMDMFSVTKENVFDVPGTGLFSSYTQRIFRRCQAEFPDLTDSRFAYWGGAIYKMGLDLRRKLRGRLGEVDLGRFNHRFHDEGIVHCLARLARIPQDRMPDRWCQCSYLPNPEAAAMIHVRTKVSPDGPKRSKMENYRAVVSALE